MKTRCFLSAAVASTVMALLIGCNEAPPPARVAVPGVGNHDQAREQGTVKPLVPMDERIDMRVDQRVPETQPLPSKGVQPGQADDADARVKKDFADAYHQVGQPKIVVLANRGFDGSLIAEPPAPKDSPYLHAGQYDEPPADKKFDYAALEKRLADQFANGQQIMLIPSDTARQKLSETQAKDLQAGKPEALSSMDERLNADVLIQVQLHPTHQTTNGLELRIVAEAINIRGGQVIGQAIADIDRPSESEQIEGASRYIAKKLMIDMLRTWTAPEQTAAPK